MPQQGLMGILQGASQINNAQAGMRPQQQPQQPQGQVADGDASFAAYLKKLLGKGGEAAPEAAMPASAGAGLGGAGASDLAAGAGMV